ncbi:MAG: hypothetical protein JNK82_06950, partial [Myxococcaceae bacterium]|nr:hypothetical protein [Myxococcaceae bacterium]
MRLLGLALAVVALVFVAVSCSGNTPACSAATCNTCCDSSGTCVTATSPTQCGQAGNMCQACDTGFACNAGVCQRTSAGGGSGATGGGSGTAGGTAGSTGGGTGATGGGTGTAGGGRAGGSGATAGGGMATAGGGAVSVTCGTHPTTPTIPITVQPTCAFPAPCGGDPQGSFAYTSACIPQSYFDDFKNRLETNAVAGIGCGAGTVTIQNIDGGLAGHAFFDGGTVCRQVNGSVTVKAVIGGSFCNQPTICNGLANINFMGYQINCFLDAGTHCDCRATSNIAINNAATYTTNATSLTINGSNQTFQT